MQQPKFTASVGIDVALLAPNDAVRIASFPNTPRGLLAFRRLLKRDGTAATTPFVIESTGIYHLPVALMLSRAGYAVKCINPIITKRHQRSSIRNVKTDTVDAERLARIGILEPNLRAFSPNPAALEARKLISYLGKLEHLRQQLRASLTDIHAMRDITPVSVNLRPSDAILKKLDEQITTITDRVCALAPGKARMLADTTPGLSRERLAIVIMALQDKAFTDRDQLAAFVGLDVMPRQSGSWRRRGRISKRGNPFVRKVLFQIAWGLKQNNTTYHAYYERLREAGKNYITALIILARKFLRFLFLYFWKTEGYPQFALDSAH